MTDPAQPAPSPAKWVPKKKTPLWVAIVIGVGGSTTPALMVALPAPWNAVVGSAIGGLTLALATYFGMKSAGTR